MISRRVLACTCVAIAASLTGCVAHKVQIVNREITEQTWLSFLEDAKTTKEEVLSRLGRPSAKFEGGSILTYRLDDKYQVVPRDYGARAKSWGLGRPSVWKRGRYSLVLVFDPAMILQRHSLVRVR